MPSPTPLPLLRLQYYEAAQEYLRSLPPEHFMEATPQATQRKITLESLDLVHARRPEVQVFNELLVQYPLAAAARSRARSCPTTWSWSTTSRSEVEGSFDRALAAGRGPSGCWSTSPRAAGARTTTRTCEKYEKELKVPYYLLFVPESEEMILFRHNRRRYVTVKPDEHGRVAIAQNWTWSWPCWTVGCGSGSAASCCRCRATCSTRWTNSSSRWSNYSGRGISCKAS